MNEKDSVILRSQNHRHIVRPVILGGRGLKHPLGSRVLLWPREIQKQIFSSRLRQDRLKATALHRRNFKYLPGVVRRTPLAHKNADCIKLFAVALRDPMAH